MCREKFELRREEGLTFNNGLLDDDQATTLYRNTQQALTGAIQHGRAGEISIYPKIRDPARAERQGAQARLATVLHTVGMPDRADEETLYLPHGTQQKAAPVLAMTHDPN